jgi:hypothetical protein
VRQRRIVRLLTGGGRAVGECDHVEACSTGTTQWGAQKPTTRLQQHHDGQGCSCTTVTRACLPSPRPPKKHAHAVRTCLIRRSHGGFYTAVGLHARDHGTQGEQRTVWMAGGGGGGQHPMRMHSPGLHTPCMDGTPGTCSPQQLTRKPASATFLMPLCCRMNGRFVEVKPHRPVLPCTICPARRAVQHTDGAQRVARRRV